MKNLKIALVHDWLTGMRGGEKCLEVLCSLYKDADLYTLIHKKGALSKPVEAMNIKTSFMQKIPGVFSLYRNFLPLMPTAIESFNLSSYDLVISTSHCVAKGVKTRAETCHISYIHTPARYAWDMFDQYFSTERNILKKFFIKAVIAYIRDWDRKSSKRVNYYIANSEHIAGKIKKFYGATASVIYPPVDTSGFTPSCEEKKSYLIVSAFAPYKRIEIAVHAFNKLGYPLKIVGSGQNEKTLKGIAEKNVEFLGWVPNKTLKHLYSSCRALIFPGEEDFGIVPVEVQAAGRPVIAYGKGGALETVLPVKGTNVSGRETGIFFYEQTPEAIIDAVLIFEKLKNKFKTESIIENAKRFDTRIYKEKMNSFIVKRYSEFRSAFPD